MAQRYNVYYEGILMEQNIDKRNFMDAYPNEFTLQEWENMRDIRAKVRGYQVLRIREGESEEDRLALLGLKPSNVEAGDIIYKDWDRITKKLYPLVKGKNIKIVWNGKD